MISKNQILVFIVSFLIAGFFLLSIPESGFSGNGGPGCCRTGDQAFCSDVAMQSDCQTDNNTYFKGQMCSCGPSLCMGMCEPPPPIPTLNQWGMIIMAAVLGMFAVIALFVMRRGSVVKPSN